MSGWHSHLAHGALVGGGIDPSLVFVLIVVDDGGLSVSPLTVGSDVADRKGAFLEDSVRVELGLGCLADRLGYGTDIVPRVAHGAFVLSSKDFRNPDVPGDLDSESGFSGWLDV